MIQASPPLSLRRCFAAASVVALVLPRAGTAAAAAVERCPPAARVEGDAALARAIQEILRMRGVEARAPASCSTVRATVRREKRSVVIVLGNSPGPRPRAQVASDATTAATVIESWARGDLAAPLLEGRPPRSPPPAPTSRTEMIATAAVAPARLPLSVGLMATAARGGDGSTWIEANASACFRIGPLCTGAMLRGTFDLATTGDSASLDTSRKGVEVLLTADIPFDLGPVTLSPGLGFGAGWLRNSFTGELPPGQNVDVDTGGLRIEGRLGAWVRLSDRLSLDLSIFAGYAPLAHTAPFVEDAREVAGAPRWMLRAGIGLRYGAP